MIGGRIGGLESIECIVEASVQCNSGQIGCTAAISVEGTMNAELLTAQPLLHAGTLHSSQ